MWKWHFGLIFGVLIAQAGHAQENPGDYVQYSLNMEGSKVKGTMIVARLVDGEEVATGYDLQRVVDFITEDCASGKVHTVKLSKRKNIARKKIVKQNFRATCVGGPHPSIGAGREASVRIERQEDGRDLAAYTYWQEGGTVVTERYRD